MIILITGASYTGKTALAQKHHADCVLIDDEYKINMDLLRLGFTKEARRMIRRFKEIEGRYIEKIIGQDRLAFAHSDTNDFYDLTEWSKAGGYQGSVILFYDFDTGNVYKPFAKKRDVIYSKGGSKKAGMMKRDVQRMSTSIMTR